MTDFKSEKTLIQEYYNALDTAPLDQIAGVEQTYAADTYVWRGFHPFGELTNPAEVANMFWVPLRTSLTRIQRRLDIFFAGTNELDGHASTWVVSMGHLMGLFDQPWLGVKPTCKMAMLRYCAFHRVEGGKIAEQMMYFDLPHLMAQAGQSPFPVQTAAHMVQPGPMTHTGLLFEAQDPAEGQATRDAINRMVADLGQWNLGLPLEEELALSWHDDMLWWGPEGIGASYTIERYAKQHSGPFRAAFSDRSKTNHIARVAEGEFGGFAGWPNFTATLSGRFMGHEPTGKRGEFRVIDLYRREGDKLAENWIFIDLLHFWKTQGVDYLAEAAT
ncbi:ester cyclase [Cognatiyoonia sp.]|uniref:nuclear transport factor 2 family protein n=1 Tax=Cognatiyoonia sp. TaxID=2211652 RepID=UPI003F69592E